MTRVVGSLSTSARRLAWAALPSTTGKLIFSLRTKGSTAFNPFWSTLKPITLSPLAP